MCRPGNMHGLKNDEAGNTKHEIQQTNRKLIIVDFTLYTYTNASLASVLHLSFPPNHALIFNLYATAGEI